MIVANFYVRGLRSVFIVMTRRMHVLMFVMFRDHMPIVQFFAGVQRQFLLFGSRLLLWRYRRMMLVGFRMRRSGRMRVR